MRIVSWNVNGIRSVHNKNLFIPMLETLKPDILCLQETKAEQGQAVIDLPDYQEYWNSAKKKGYSGTAIFSKVKPLAVHIGFDPALTKKYELIDGYGDLTSEGRVITLEFEQFYVVNCYTPNSKGDLSRLPMRHKHWDPAFLEHCETLAKKKEVVFCGDLNVAHTADDLANPKENEGEHGFTQEEREGVDNIITAGFVDTLRMFTAGKGHYTWWTPWRNARERNVGWRIDYVFVSASMAAKVKSASIHANILGSDHCPVSVDIG
ncbi:MAG: exodeoxyribonuclease III [Candidatus Pacebacteria bacterium]|nr:exodeoxyribonuclease III [Candidatus Paceibacterota bacterium]